MIKDYTPDRCGCAAPTAIASVVRHAVQPFLVRARQISTFTACAGRQVVLDSPSVRKGYDEITTRRSLRTKSRLAEKKILSKPALGWAIATKSV
jgi:hypothetical protein